MRREGPLQVTPNTAEMRRDSEDPANCFLCSPEPQWTWLESDHFRAVLGLGPIGFGYTLIAARDHVPSMLDLEPEVAAELDWFTRRVRDALRPLGGPAVVAEHGRVAACVAPVVSRHEPHCLHAHRLVFPGVEDLDLRAVAPAMRVEPFERFTELHAATDWTGHYLYVEQPDGGGELGLVEGPLPRQFLRALAARRLRSPELADWRSKPRPDLLDEARRCLEQIAV